MRPAAISLLGLLAAACQPPVAPGPSAGAQVVALFDPTATPPVLPTPNDLAFTGGDGVHLNVPIDPNAPLALQDFNKFLNTLDGFPSLSNAVTAFSSPIAVATATGPSGPANGSIVAVDLDAGVVLQADDLQASLSVDGLTLTIMPSRRFKTGGHYAVALFGGDDANGLHGANGEPVVASQTFFFLRSPLPLVGLCGDGTQPGCVCPPAIIAAADAAAGTCHPTVQGLDLATAYAAEQQRLLIAPLLDQILAVAGPGRSRNDLVLAWTFRITTAPEAIFDVARGDIPFPNDALINQSTHLVSLPIASGDPMAPIKMGLNQLDGFSTTAATTVSVDTKDNVPVTNLTGATQLLNITPATTSLQPTIDAASVLVMNNTTYTGQVALQPRDALLPDQSRYLGVLTGDATDAAGRHVIPSPPFVLLRGTNPLFDGTHTLVPGVLSDSDAAQLEVLRQAYQPAFAELSTLGISANKISALWTFTTQSITRPLNALVAYPTQAGLTESVTVDNVVDVNGALPGTPNFPVGNLKFVVFGTFQSQNVIDPTSGVIGFDRQVSDPTDPTTDVFKVHAPASAAATTIKYVMTIPKGGGAAPVAIVQHGLTEWRGQVMLLADTFASMGIATIAIDVNFHGARSICTMDNQCNGTCDMTTHKCTGGFLPAPASQDPFACTLQVFDASDPDNCRPAVSGQDFVNTADLFTSRDNLRQYVVDAAQLMRVVQGTGAGSLQAQLAGQSIAIDNTQVTFLGQSLGAILGTVYLSAAPQPTVAYLSTVGGHDFEELGAGAFANIVDQYLMSIGVMRDSAAYVQVVGTTRWILDPADPFAVGRNLIQLPITSYLTTVRNPKKIILQQEAGMDMVIPDIYQAALATQIFGAAGLDANGHVQSAQTDGTIVSTFWPTAEHGSLFSPPPSATVTQALQTNAATWLSTKGAVITPVTQ